VDVLCFEGTKNGLAVGEAVIFFDKTLAERFRLSAQTSRPARFQNALPLRAMVAVLESGAWLRLPKSRNPARRQGE
jgi:threonine aldolase